MPIGRSIFRKEMKNKIRYTSLSSASTAAISRIKCAKHENVKNLLLLRPHKCEKHGTWRPLCDSNLGLYLPLVGISIQLADDVHTYRILVLLIHETTFGLEE